MGPIEDDAPGAPAWERDIRRQFASNGQKIVTFSANRFPELAEALEVRQGDSKTNELALRVRTSARGLKKVMPEDWRYDEFRALVQGGCAWWGISDLRPTKAQWAQHVRFAQLSTLRVDQIDSAQRSFRHSWAGFQYRRMRENLGENSDLRDKDYNLARRDLGKSFQDALIALLHALVEGGEGIEYWDFERNRFVRTGYAVPDDAREVDALAPRLRRMAPADSRLIAFERVGGV